MLYNLIPSKHYTILEVVFRACISSLYKCSKYILYILEIVRVLNINGKFIMIDIE